MRAHRLLSVLFVCPFVVYGQAIENLKATNQGGKVTISYDLTSGNPNQKFNLDLYSSIDNYATSLKRVAGDIGKNVSPGLAKKIEWDALGELKKFSGDVTFKLKGAVIIEPLSFQNPSKAVKGKPTTLNWTGGAQNQNAKLEVFQGPTMVVALPETANRGTCEWVVPKDLPKGTYSLRLTVGTDTASSGEFLVKNKTPLWMIIVPPVVVAAAVVVIIELLGEETPPSNDLPDPPGPK